MFDFVTDAEISEYRSYCSGVLTELRDKLYEYDINTQFVLVGSGARNMVMRDGNGPFDLDYNLRIIDMPEDYWKAPGNLKNLVRNTLNSIVRNTWFSDGKDSTSVITALLQSGTNTLFKFDLAIIGDNGNGNLCRLIHDKHSFPERFFWNEVPNSHNIKAKVNAIKQAKKWLEVREKYKDLKNLYLSRHDYNHPSFICYIEAVNAIHQKYFSKRKH